MTASVAMATYNGAAYLEEQLDSVLSQLSEADELVVSDDGSTDGTRDILARFAARDARIRLIDGPQKGAIANFEHAIAHTRGDVIFLCDQDDVWCAGKYRAVMAAFDDPEAVLVMHDAAVTDAAGAVLEPSFFALRGTKVGFWKNLWKNSYIGCCMAFSSALKPIVLPFPDTIPMHDQWIGMKAERCGKVTLIKEPLLRYRRHESNVTASSRGSLGTMLRQRWGMLRALRQKRKG